VDCSKFKAGQIHYTIPEGKGTIEAVALLKVKDTKYYTG
jgi:hypothetical protein